MLRIVPGLRARKSVVAAATAALLLAAALPGNALGAGPDDPPLSSEVKTGSGPITGGVPAGAADTADGSIIWNTFEGHAFTDGQLSAAGTALIACLGGCDGGYRSAPVTVGIEGRYHGLKVGRPASEQAVGEQGKAIRFWLILESDNWVDAPRQATVFQEQSVTRQMELSFVTATDAAADASNPAADAATSTVAGDAMTASGMSASGMTAGAANPEWRTTDLTLPDAADLGLVPANSAAGFAATTLRYQGIPLLPGLVTALGLTLAGVGVSLLMYRRRIAW